MATTPALGTGDGREATGLSNRDAAPAADTSAVDAVPALGTAGPAVPLPTAARVDFGIDALGRWRADARDGHGALLPDPAADGGPPLDLAGYPTDDPAGAVALQQALRARFPGADIVWRPGIMDTLDENAAAAHRALAAAGADRQAARTAADQAASSLRAAAHLARDAGLGPVEIADRTGYARSTITKLLTTLDPGSAPPAPA